MFRKIINYVNGIWYKNFTLRIIPKSVKTLTAKTASFGHMFIKKVFDSIWWGAMFLFFYEFYEFFKLFSKPATNIYSYILDKVNSINNNSINQASENIADIGIDLSKEAIKETISTDTVLATASVAVSVAASVAAEEVTINFIKGKLSIPEETCDLIWPDALIGCAYYGTIGGIILILTGPLGAMSAGVGIGVAHTTAVVTTACGLTGTFWVVLPKALGLISCVCANKYMKSIIKDNDLDNDVT